MTDSIPQATERPPAACASRRVGGSGPIAAGAALLLVLSAAPLEAQRRPAEVHARLGTGIFFEAAQHVTAGASYRQYLGQRGWALEPEYSFMTEGSHQDHMVILNVVKDFRPPSHAAVPYMVMGAGISFHRTPTRSVGGLGGLAWGVGLKRRIGRRLFFAPELRIGLEPNVRLLVRLGFAPFGGRDDR